MKKHHRRALVGFSIVSLALAACGADRQGDDDVVTTKQPLLEDFVDRLPNNFPIPNAHGLAASYSTTTAPIVPLNNDFFTPKGTNGRDCGTCHAAEDGWSIQPSTVTLMFLLSDGLDPLFVNNLDTDTPTCDMSTTASRWNCTRSEERRVGKEC